MSNIDLDELERSVRTALSDGYQTVQLDIDVVLALIARTKKAESAGDVLGQVIVACSLRPYESLSRPIEHAAVDSVRALLADRDRLHSMHEDETTWRKNAEGERDAWIIEQQKAKIRAALAIYEAWLMSGETESLASACAALAHVGEALR